MMASGSRGRNKCDDDLEGQPRREAIIEPCGVAHSPNQQSKAQLPPFSIQLLESEVEATQDNIGQHPSTPQQKDENILPPLLPASHCAEDGHLVARTPQENGAQPSSAHRRNDNHILPLLPASYRTKDDDLAAASQDVMCCIEKELNLDRLNEISTWLWVVGRPVPPRPLHHQLLLSRKIFITEQMDMHLVWTTGRMFLKPIPRFLLEPSIWTEYLSCNDDCTCDKPDSQGSGHRCKARKLWRCALGFLFSYAALIMYESDFLIAQEENLLPKEVKWLDWRTLVQQLETEEIYSRIDGRFHYGELRLSRLNKIYVFSRGRFLRGYMTQWNRYTTFLQDNFQWLTSVTVFIAIILTAMQVGLATNSLVNNAAFQSVSYGFTVFSIVGPLVAIGFIIFGFCIIFIGNWIATVKYEQKRHRSIFKNEGNSR